MGQTEGRPRPLSQLLCPPRMTITIQSRVKAVKARPASDLGTDRNTRRLTERGRPDQITFSWADTAIQ